MPYKVKLTYFKKSGNYYGEGEYTSEKQNLYEIWDEIEEMFEAKKRPGLVDGKQEFNTLVNVSDHPHAHPHIIMVDRLWY